MDREYQDSDFVLSRDLAYHLIAFARSCQMLRALACIAIAWILVLSSGPSLLPFAAFCGGTYICLARAFFVPKRNWDIVLARHAVFARQWPLSVSGNNQFQLPYHTLFNARWRPPDATEQRKFYERRISLSMIPFFGFNRGFLYLFTPICLIGLYALGFHYAKDVFEIATNHRFDSGSEQLPQRTTDLFTCGIAILLATIVPKVIDPNTLPIYCPSVLPVVPQQIDREFARGLAETLSDRAPDAIHSSTPFEIAGELSVDTKDDWISS